MKNKMSLIIAAIVTLAAVGVICVLSVEMASDNDGGFRLFDFSIGGKAELRNTIELSAGEVQDLRLEYGSKNIQVYPIEGDTIVIKEYLYSDLPAARAVVEYPADGVVSVTGGNVQTLVCFGFGIGGGERIEVYIPDQTLAALSLKTGSGNSKGEGSCLADGGSLVVKAGSGNIKWKGTKGAELIYGAGSGNITLEELTGALSVETGSGNIKGEKLTGTINVRAGSGNIDLGALSGNGRAQANSGNVKISAEVLNGDMSIQTGSGNAKLEVPADLGFGLEINTGSGSIHTDYDNILSYNKKGNHAEGSVGDAPAIQISLNTGSGNARVVSKN